MHRVLMQKLEKSTLHHGYSDGFLLTILASQDPRPGCLRSHGRCGTTTLTRTVVDVHWQLPGPQNTSKRRQVLQLQCTKDEKWHDCVWLSLFLTKKKRNPHVPLPTQLSNSSSQLARPLYFPDSSAEGTWRDCLRFPWRRQLEPIPHWVSD